MYIEIYLDVVFAVNFIMDFVILILERQISKKRVSINRIFFGALTGAILMCIIVLLPQMSHLVTLVLSYLVCSVLIVKVTFKPTQMKELLRLTLLLYIIAILLGGIIFVLYYYSLMGYGIKRLIKSETFYGLDLQMLMILLCFAIIVCIIFINIFFKVMHMSKNIYGVKISYRNQEIDINALLDTGNNLYDPITRYPVIIGEIEILRNFFDETHYCEIQKVLDNIYDINNMEYIQNLLGLNIRLIPFSSIGNENGMLLGIVLDKIVVHIGKEFKENKNVIIALYNKKLSKDNSYNALLHPQLI